MKTRDDKNKFLEILREIPLISVAAQKAGIAKSTIYRWVDKDEEFGQQMRLSLSVGVNTINDLAEGTLIGMIRKENFRAIKLWLDNNSPKYVRPRPEPPESKHVPVTQIIIGSADEALEEMRKNNDPRLEHIIGNSPDVPEKPVE